MLFHEGDRVCVIAPQANYKTIGLTGTVVLANDDFVGVCHDAEFPDGHSCEGLCERGYGLWYFNADRQLKLLPTNYRLDDLVTDPCCLFF